MFKKFINWLVQSSENPSQISLTVKGAIATTIPWLVTFGGLFHLTALTSANLTPLGVAIVAFIQATLSAIGAGIFLYGLARKLINTFFIPWPTDPTVIAAIGAPKV